MKRTCFKCLKDLKPVFKNDVNLGYLDNVSCPPDDATYWTSSGNYGSTVLDTGNFYLEIYICDECLVSSQATIYKVTRITPKIEVQSEIWHKNENT